MSNSFGHQLRKATDDELHYRWAPETHLRCTHGKCRELASHMSRYSYITGKAGRFSYADRLLCPVHAKKFARNHKIELPLEPVS